MRVPDDIGWKGFESLVHAIESRLRPNCRMVLDSKLRDRITGNARQVDIAVYIPGPDGISLLILECKHYRTRRVTQPDVEQFASFIMSVRGDRGIMVTSSGFTQAAQLYARAMGISLFTLEAACGAEWQGYLDSVVEKSERRRISAAQIRFFTDESVINLDRSILLGSQHDLNIYYRSRNGSYRPVANALPEDGVVCGTIFYLQPTIVKFVVELLFEQVNDKLDISGDSQRDLEYHAFCRKIGNVSKDGGVFSNRNVAYLIHSRHQDFANTSNAVITWLSLCNFSWRQGQESRFIHTEDGFEPIQRVELLYKAEVLESQSWRGKELTELDVIDGVAYVDVLANSRSFYVLDELPFQAR